MAVAGAPTWAIISKYEPKSGFNPQTNDDQDNKTDNTGEISTEQNAAD